MASPDITDTEIAAVNQVLRTTSLSLGPQLDAFESEFARYVGARHAVGVNSGTSGLHLAVMVAGIGKGDLVVTTPFSFIASANCILYAGAVPVFVDVNPRTGNMDADQVETVVEDLVRGGAAARKRVPRVAQPGARVAALLPVHAFGEPLDMQPMMDVSRRHRIPVIEDACEAIGAECRGKRIGSHGNTAVFAFYPNKQMTCGEGGMVVTDDPDRDAILRSLRNQGRSAPGQWLEHVRLGYNYRLDEMSSALGLAQLRRLDELLAKRSRVAGWYDERLAGLEFLRTPQSEPTTTRRSWFVYVVQIQKPWSRDEIIRLLLAEGIPSRPYFSPIHLQPFYRELFQFNTGDFPETERLGDVCLALPFSGVMTEGQVDLVSESLLRVVGRLNPARQ